MTPTPRSYPSSAKILPAGTMACPDCSHRVGAVTRICAACHFAPWWPFARDDVESFTAWMLTLPASDQAESGHRAVSP